jgi:hypothetical protein
MLMFLSTVLAHLQAFVVSHHALASETVALRRSLPFTSAGNLVPNCIDPTGCCFGGCGATAPTRSLW